MDHGGGFCWGTARDGTGLRLAEGLGRTVVSVEYPLAPEARFPVAIDVCVDAYLAGVAERGPRVLLRIHTAWCEGAIREHPVP